MKAGFVSKEKIMTLPIVLTIAACAALLVGLFGGGIKAKEIEVPTISFLPSELPPTRLVPIEVSPTNVLPTDIPLHLKQNISTH
jgi:hypothetical protein